MDESAEINLIKHSNAQQEDGEMFSVTVTHVVQRSNTQK